MCGVIPDVFLSSWFNPIGLIWLARKQSYDCCRTSDAPQGLWLFELVRPNADIRQTNGNSKQIKPYEYHIIYAWYVHEYQEI